MLKKTLLVAAFAVFATAGPASAAIINTYGFYRITNNGSQDVAGQLFVDVIGTDALATSVEFKFYNVGPLASSITDLYFDDGTLLGISSVTSGLGVTFSKTAKPGDLPSGNSITPAFVTSGDNYSADSTAPTQPNGVNPGEFVTITFGLVNGKTYSDTIAALALGAVDGGNSQALRIGIHVQGLPDGESDSFINQVPDGGMTLALLGLGLTGIEVLRRRARR